LQRQFGQNRLTAQPQSRPIFVHVVYGRGSVLLRRADEIPGWEGAILGVFPIDNVLYCTE